MSMALNSYVDHVRLWTDELKRWLPPVLFDAHVHLGPPEIVAPLRPERLKQALSTFSHFTLESLDAWYAEVYSGKQVAGLIAFPFPLQEVDLDGANRYLIGAMKRSPRIKGFALAHPTDAGSTISAFELARQQGTRFWGAKPYFDLVGKSVFDCTMSEFIPEALLAFMDRERLILMLHTSRRGMGDRENQDYLRRVMEKYSDLRIILAHMGRYIEANEFFRFCDSGLLVFPTLFLEMSSASRADVYSRVLEHPETFDRLVFGSDLPFGLITGMEAWSEQAGPIFVTRDRYSWSDPTLEQTTGIRAESLTYNTYHTIKAFKDALCSNRFPPEQTGAIKEAVFYRNAASLFADG
jgi:predicted TIM-barrel fold metal-dependent hydrolase